VVDDPFPPFQGELEPGQMGDGGAAQIVGCESVDGKLFRFIVGPEPMSAESSSDQIEMDRHHETGFNSCRTSINEQGIIWISFSMSLQNRKCSKRQSS